MASNAPSKFKKNTKKKIIFKHDQHSSVGSSMLSNFYKQAEFCDISVLAGINGVSIQAHRIVLCAYSEYFLEILQSTKHSSTLQYQVQIKEIEASTLKPIIEFMYFGSIELSFETVADLLKAASFLKIEPLIKGCCSFVEKNIDYRNSLSWYQLACDFTLPRLKENILTHICNNFDTISKHKQLTMLTENQFEQLLESIKMATTKNFLAEEAFLAIVAWINYDQPNREHLVPQLLSKVSFENLTLEFIMKNRKIVCRNIESYELVCSWLQWHLSPETRPERNTTKQKHDRLTIVQNCKLVNFRIFDIKTYDSNLKLWSIERTLSPVTDYEISSTILCDNKLLAATNIHFTHILECIDLQTCKKSLIQSQSNKVILQMAFLKGYLCVLFFLRSFEVSLELYSFSRRQWENKVLPFLPTMFCKLVTNDEMLYLLDFTVGSLGLYNIFLNQWRLENIRKEALINFGLAVDERFLYILGGKLEEEIIDKVKCYNLSDNSWSTLASLPQAREQFNAVICENKILTSDGFYVDEYNIDNDTWETFSSLKTRKKGGVKIISWETNP
ncbi:kelch-like protein 7 [Eupeodes corollae]|uniref:kelch-like protein 7 n=1 Tax=Eupeodes corollae TaxID=290404 RepID=UPI0024930A02|nr:kelch-like protein 7 [Eupeodes corollae]